MIKKILGKYLTIRQFIRFVLTGGLNTSIDLGILNILMFSTGYYEGGCYMVLKTISFTCAATFSYFMNKYWVFKAKLKKKEVKKFSQFFLVSVFGAVINVGVATLVVTFLKPAVIKNLPLEISGEIWGTIGAIFGSAIGLIWNFMGYKFIVFKKQPASNP